MNPLAEPMYREDSSPSFDSPDFVHPLLKINCSPAPVAIKEELSPSKDVRSETVEKPKADLPEPPPHPAFEPATKEIQQPGTKIPAEPPKTREAPRKWILIGTGVVTAGILLAGTLLYIGTHHRDTAFTKALSERNIEKAKALAGKSPSRMNDVRLLEIVVSEQARKEHAAQQNQAILSQYARERWADIERMMASAKNSTDMVAVLQIYRQVDLAVEECRQKLKKLIDIEASIRAMIAGPSGAELLARYFPDQWASIQVDMSKAGKEADLQQAEKAWHEIWDRIRLLKQEATRQTLAEGQMLEAKTQWQTLLRKLQENSPESFAELRACAPEVAAKIGAMEKKAADFTGKGLFKEAEDSYRELMKSLTQALADSEKNQKEILYRTALAEARTFAKEQNWVAACQALDRAEASNVKDRSEAARLRMSIELNLEAVSAAQTQYKELLASLDTRRLEQTHPDQWNELKKTIQRAEQEKSPAEAVRIYADAHNQLQQMQRADEKLKTAAAAHSAGCPSPSVPWQAKIAHDSDMSFAPIAPGSFFMGTETGAPYEKPIHIVHISEPFWIGYFEVTLKQFSAFLQNDKILAETISRRSATPKERAISSDGNQPICNINWKEAVMFCNWLTRKEQAAGRLSSQYKYVLPTEAQWEYACRAGQTSEFQGDLSEVGWYKENSDLKTHTVGGKKPNAWGLYDMQGNVAEWCEDNWHNDYFSAPADGSAWLVPDYSQRVFRGGSFYSSPDYCQYSSRGLASENVANTRCGFRVALIKVTSGNP